MLKDLVDFINIMFLVIAPPLGMFGIFVVVKMIYEDVYEIEEKDQEKICLKK